MSYTDVVGRISELETLMRRVDPQWATSGYSMANYPGIINSGSLFSGVLESITGQQTPDAGAAGASGSASPAFAGGSSATGGSTAGSKFNVIGRSGYDSVSFQSPLPSSRLSQAFGPSSEPLEPSATIGGVTYAHYHNGIDMAAPLGSTIRAAASGLVTYAGRQSDGAVVVKIRHADGYVSLYAHLDPSLQVAVGQQVTQGQALGQVGMTGNTTGPHLHFGLYNPGGTAVDPSTWLKAGNLPAPATLLGPSDSDPATLTQVSGSATLARFDAVSAQIPYAAEIRQAAVANGIDPLLLTSLVYAESNFHPNAVSKCGAMGLTQLMPGTARGLGVTDAFDPQQNLNGGAAYIARQMKSFGRVDLALAAYNAGPGTISRLGVVPNSTRGYVSKILGKWTSYQEPAG
jgi:hypothetical protein